jgi:NADH-quinone oxidoreductase subunit G
VVGGVDPVDLPDPRLARAALERVDFLVSLEVRASAVSELADVVLPVAPVAEKAGMFVDWEGRVRPFDKVLRESHALPDLRVLAGVADEMGVDLGFRTVEQARAEMADLGAWDGPRSSLPAQPSERQPSGREAATTDRGGDGSAVLTTWKLLLDDGRMLDGDDHLKATARPPVALLSAATMAGLGLAPGEPVTLTAPSGSRTLPVAVADLADGVVWAPTTSAWTAPAGSVVRLASSKGTLA